MADDDDDGRHHLASRTPLSIGTTCAGVPNWGGDADGDFAGREYRRSSPERVALFFVDEFSGAEPLESLLLLQVVMPSSDGVVGSVC